MKNLTLLMISSILIKKFNLDIEGEEMKHDWKELTQLTQGADVEIERVRIKDSGIVLEGSFELPPLAQLTLEDQIFITAFIRCGGSIKEMEELFGISYPTVKNRINGIASKLEFVEINPPASSNEILNQLDKGEISVEEAINKLGGSK
jgi:hypothetical protein